MSLIARTMPIPMDIAETPQATAQASVLRFWQDTLVVLVLLVSGFFGSLYTQSKMDTRLYAHPSGDEVYFNADVPRVYSNMTDRMSNHFRSKVHPLILMLSYPPVIVLEKALHLTPERSVQVVIASMVGLWLAVFFTILRVSGSRFVDAILFTLLLASSGAAMVWSATPETYLFGSVTLLAPLLIMAASYYRQIGWKTYVAVSALSMSATITNWMSGIAVSICSLPRKTAIKVIIYSFYAVVTVWGVQQAIFKNTPFFLDPAVERHEVFRSEWGGPTHNLRSALFSGMVLPEIKSMQLPFGGGAAAPRPNYNILTLQLSQPGSAGLAGKIAAVLWSLLVLGGVVALFTIKERPAFRLALGGLLLCQLILHTVYGEEAFLYALHYMPLFVIVIAMAARTRVRPVVLVATCLLIGTSAYNNIGQFKYLTQAIHQHCDLHFADTVVEE